MDIIEARTIEHAALDQVYLVLPEVLSPNLKLLIYALQSALTLLTKQFTVIQCLRRLPREGKGVQTSTRARPLTLMSISILSVKYAGVAQALALERGVAEQGGRLKKQHRSSKHTRYRTEGQE